MRGWSERSGVNGFLSDGNVKERLFSSDENIYIEVVFVHWSNRYEEPIPSVSFFFGTGTGYVTEIIEWGVVVLFLWADV